jgi:hypothetical protein
LSQPLPDPEALLARRHVTYGPTVASLLTAAALRGLRMPFVLVGVAARSQSKTEAFVRASDMGKDTIQWPGNVREVQRADEQPRVADLPAAVGAEEAPKLLLAAPCSPGRLPLERAERSKLALGLDDPFHAGGAQAADQLVLEVGDAHVEPEGFHLGATEAGTQAGQGVGRCGNQPSRSAAGRRLDGCQLESLLVVHLPSLVLQP